MKLHRAVFLLELLSANNNKPITGTTKLQKLMFLIKKKVLNDTFYEQGYYIFEPYKYGPFTVEIVDDIQLLKDLGLIEESGFGDNVTYKITDLGKQKIVDIQKEIPENILKGIEKIKKEYGDLALSKLLSFVYQRYSEYTINSEIRDKIFY